jgi:hypothetical protein
MFMGVAFFSDWKQLLGSGKHPIHEVHCSKGHANPEDDTGKHLLPRAFSVREHQSANDDGNQRKTLGDGAGETDLQIIDKLGVMARAAMPASRTRLGIRSPAFS